MKTSSHLGCTLFTNLFKYFTLLSQIVLYLLVGVVGKMQTDGEEVISVGLEEGFQFFLVFVGPVSGNVLSIGDSVLPPTYVFYHFSSLLFILRHLLTTHLIQLHLHMHHHLCSRELKLLACGTSFLQIQAVTIIAPELRNHIVVPTWQMGGDDAVVLSIDAHELQVAIFFLFAPQVVLTMLASRSTQAVFGAFRNQMIQIMIAPQNFALFDSSVRKVFLDGFLVVAMHLD
jgi:hypothetical protein